MNLFASKQPPPKVPTDTVIPFHYFDDQQYLRAIVLHFTYRFDDVLDSEKLRGALARLMTIGGWRKLGARLRLNVDGKLEYHVPAAYDDRRPGFSYTSVNTGISIKDHELASQLPHGGRSESALFQDPAFLKPLVLQDSTPKRMEDLLYLDAPQLSVKIVTFTDGTLLTFSWLHTLLDAVGRASFLKAWIAVLNGKEEEVPEFVGFEQDPLDALDGKVPPEKHLLYDKLITGWSFALFVIYAILDALIYRKDENKVIYLPGHYVKQLRYDALQSLTVTENPGTETPFISEGDVLLAWVAQTIVKALSPRPSRPILLMNVMNLRGGIDDLIGPDQAYIGNATTSSNTYLTAKQLLNQPLGSTALMVRRSLLEQRTREQFEALVALHKRQTKQKRPMLFGSADMIMIVLSNWTRGKFYDFDFSAAVVKPGIPVERRANKLGQPSYINITGDNNGPNLRNAGPCIGKDAAGNWWLVMTLRSGAWKAVEKQLRDGLKDER